MIGTLRYLLSGEKIPPSRSSGELIERYLYLSGELPKPKGGTILSKRLLEILVKRQEDIQSGVLRK